MRCRRGLGVWGAGLSTLRVIGGVVAASSVGRVALTRVSELRVSEENPRTIEPGRLEQLKRALEADPEMLRARPVVALPDGTVVAGNMRLVAARELGWDKIPAVRADLDQERARLWMLRDNQSYGEWEEEGLAVLLGELERDGADLDLAGFVEGDLRRLLDSLRPPKEVDQDFVPEVPAEPRSKLGEIYELGPHRLMCGDATDFGMVEELLAGDRPGIGIADPPYNVDEDYETYDDDRSEADYSTFTERWFPLLRDRTDRQIVTPGWNNLPLWCRLHRFSSIAVWTKANAMTRGSISRFNTWEPILFFGKGWQTRVRSSDVFDVPVRQQPGGAGMPVGGVSHPCPKPVELWRDLVLVGGLDNESVFDPFAGVGTAIIAAEDLGRRCFAMEIDPAYCDVIRQRYEDFVGG